MSRLSQLTNNELAILAEGTHNNGRVDYMVVYPSSMRM
jgi:hypothetical protein